MPVNRPTRGSGTVGADGDRRIAHRRKPPMIDVLFPYADAAIAAEVRASTRRWLERAVIGLNLCPFAKAVHVRQQIRYAVTAARTAGELRAELAHELEALAQADPARL